MAVNETVGIDITVNGAKAAEQIGSIRSQIKAATVSLVEAQQKFGDYSKEALDAARKLATLKDKIAEANETANLFDPGKKFQALTGSITAVAGAFSAVQGAIGLLGVESAEVEKAILRVQSAMALSQGLSAIADSAKDFERLGAIIKSNVITSLASLRASAISAFATMRASAVTAFTTIRGALIATGVGAFAIALGLIVSNFDAIKEAVLKAIPGLANVGKIFTGLVEKVTDFVGITNQAERSLEKFTKTSERRKETLEADLKVLEATGASEKVLSEKRKEIVNTDLNVLRQKLKTNGELSKEEMKKFRELKTDLILIDTKYNKSVTDENKKRNDEIAKQNKEAAEKELAAAKKRLEDLRKGAEDARAEYEKNQARINKEDEDIANRNTDKFLSDQEKEVEIAQAKYDKLYEERLKFGGDLEGVEEARQEELLKIQEKYDQQALENLSTTSEEIVQNTRATQQMQTEDAKKNADARKKIAQEEAKAKIVAAQATADTLANLSNLLGQETAAGKAAAVASATISAILSAQKAYESTIGIPFVGPVLAPINAGLALASGYKSIQNILSVQVPGQSGGGSAPSLGSAPSAGAGAPIAPRSAEPIPTSLDQRSLNTISNVTTRAYVVESDITGSQKRIERIEKASRF